MKAIRSNFIRGEDLIPRPFRAGLLILILFLLPVLIFADVSERTIVDEILDNGIEMSTESAAAETPVTVEPSETPEPVIAIENANGLDALWRQFLGNRNPNRQVEILISLGNRGRGNRQIIDNLNNHLMGMNLLFRAGTTVNYTVVSACITAIMELGDSSSYPALFSVLYAGYPEVIASEALGALEVIPGNLHQFLLNVITNNPGAEKFAAFRAGISSERLTISERGQLAEVALEKALEDTEDNVDITAMRYAAIIALTDLRWTRANALAIRHYYRVQSDFINNNVSKNRFVEAIFCLGAVGNSDAALVLGLQLGLINARTERTGVFDADITLALVQALGNIGFNAAFDHLLNVSNLSYPEDIRAAAREAVNRLRW